MVGTESVASGFLLGLYLYLPNLRILIINTSDRILGEHGFLLASVMDSNIYSSLIARLCPSRDMSYLYLLEPCREISRDNIPHRERAREVNDQIQLC